jgi:potassium-dependent mechanosensitive channel
MRTGLLILLLHTFQEVSTPGETLVPADTATDAGPQAISLPLILRSAEEARRTLRSMSERASVQDLIVEIQRELPELVSKTDPLVARGAVVSVRDVADVGPALRRADETLSGWDADLESAVRAAYEEMQALQRREVTWALTESEAKAEHAPPSLLGRVATVRADIRTTSERIQGQLDGLLATQDQVVSVRQRIEDALSAVKQIEAREAEQLFEAGSVPLWKLLGRPLQPERSRQHVVKTLRSHSAALGEFVAVKRERALLLLGVLAALTAVLWRGRRRLLPEAPSDPDLAAARRVLLQPFASAALLTLGFATLLLQQRPPVVSQFILLGMLVAFLGAGRSLIPERSRRSTYVLAASVALYVLSSLAPELSLLRRMLLLVVDLTAAAALFGALRRREWETELPSSRWRGVFRAGMGVGALLLGGAAVANVLGNLGLAQLLTTGTLGSVSVLLLLYGVLVLLRGLLVIGLRSTRVKRWPLVANHAELFRTRIIGVFQWGAGLLWLFTTARFFKVAAPIWVALGRIASFHAKVGAIDISVADILAFGIALWLSVLLSRFAGFVLEEGLTNRGFTRGVPAAISRTASYAIIAVGTVLAFLAAGVEITKFAVVIGTLGVGIGFGLQNVVNNFVSGLILLYERPIRVGDLIEVGSVSGTVLRIGIRSSTVATGTGAEVVVPNGDLISKELTNWTLSDRRRLIEIDASVASEASPDRVRELLLQVAAGNPGILRTPEPEALLTGFGDNALKFQLQAWTEMSDTWPRIASELRTAIARALEQAGIQGPHNDVRLVAVTPGFPAPPGRDGEGLPARPGKSS